MPTKKPEKLCGELLAQYENGGDDFLARIVREDETWLHHFEPETAAVNGMALCELAQEKEIQICTFGRKSCGYGLF
jgi:hypothetical protein